MKKLLILLAVLATPAFALGKQGHMTLFHETQSLTRAAPSADPNVNTLGQLLRGAVGYRVTVCAASGQTLSGAGTVDVYYWSLAGGGPSLWSYNLGIQESVSVTATSCSGAACRCQTFPDRAVNGPGDFYVLPAAHSITVSGGTTVDIYLEAWSG